MNTGADRVFAWAIFLLLFPTSFIYPGPRTFYANWKPYL